LLLPWLAFTINGLEQGWLAQCQFKDVGSSFLKLLAFFKKWL